MPGFPFCMFPVRVGWKATATLQHTCLVADLLTCPAVKQQLGLNHSSSCLDLALVVLTPRLARCVCACVY